MKIGTLNVSNQGLAQQTQNLTGPEKFRQTLAGVTSALAGAAGAAAPFFPGGAVVSAALSGFSNTTQQAITTGGGPGPFGGTGGVYSPSGIGGDPSGGAIASLVGGGGGIPGMETGLVPQGVGGTLGNPEAQLQQGFAQQMYLMQIQQQAQQSNETFTTMSNLMSVRHQTAASAIQNIR